MTSAVFVPGRIAVAKVFAKAARGRRPADHDALCALPFRRRRSARSSRRPRSAPMIVPIEALALPVALATKTSSCGGSPRPKSSAPISFAQR